jgi:hypothetical protein
MCKIKAPENPVRSGSEAIKGLNGDILYVVRHIPPGVEKRPFLNRHSLTVKHGGARKDMPVPFNTRTVLS